MTEIFPGLSVRQSVARGEAIGFELIFEGRGAGMEPNESRFHRALVAKVDELVIGPALDAPVADLTIEAHPGVIRHFRLMDSPGYRHSDDGERLYDLRLRAADSRGAPLAQLVAAPGGGSTQVFELIPPVPRG